MSDVLNKKALAEVLAEKCDLSKKAASDALDVVFDTVANTLKAGGRVDIAGFGKFEVKERAAREGINPATGEKLKIAASKSPKFKASKALKDLVK